MFELPRLSRRLDAVAIDRFLALSYVPNPRTAYASVRKLEPGHFIIADATGIETRRFWSLPPARSVAGPGDALAELDKSIARSVRRMMRSDVPLGAFLSGGLDSSTIVFHLARMSDIPVPTFSFRFHEREFDEGGQARATSRLLGTDHQEVWGEPRDLLDVVELTRYFGEPFADPSQVPTFLVAREAAKSVKVILSGDGGDEVLGGYETYCASLFARGGAVIPDHLRRAALRATGLLPVSTTKHVSWDYRLRKFLDGCHLPPWEHHARWRTVFTPDERRRLYDGSHVERLGDALDDPVFSAHRSLFDGTALDRLTAFQYLDVLTYLTDNNLAKADRMSMANSLELRVPFLDEGVFAAARHLPARQRVQGLRTKIALRRIMRRRLPPGVVKGRKRGFAVPIAQWLRGPLRGFLTDSLAPHRVGALGYLRSEIVDELVREHLRGSANRGRQLWSLICLVTWHEQHVAHEDRCPNW